MQFSPHDPCQALDHHLRLILQFAPEPVITLTRQRMFDRFATLHQMINSPAFFARIITK
jgi:hypothetical protein